MVGRPSETKLETALLTDIPQAVLLIQDDLRWPFYQTCGIWWRCHRASFVYEHLPSVRYIRIYHIRYIYLFFRVLNWELLDHKQSRIALESWCFASTWLRHWLFARPFSVASLLLITDLSILVITSWIAMLKVSWNTKDRSANAKSIQILWFRWEWKVRFSVLTKKSDYDVLWLLAATNIGWEQNRWVLFLWCLDQWWTGWHLKDRCEWAQRSHEVDGGGHWRRAAGLMRFG